MRRFVLRFLLFCLPLMVVFFCTDAFISGNLSKANNGEYGVWRDVFKGTVNADVVIYGASRAVNHIDPATIADTLHQSTYNLGIHAYTFKMQYLRHRVLLQHNPKPRLIIYSLDFMTFEKRAELFNPEQFLPYMLNDTLVKKYTSNYVYSWWDYTLPVVRYYGHGTAVRHALSLYTRKTPEPVERIRGYLPDDEKFTAVFNEGVKDAKRFYEIKFDGPTIQLFNQFLQECKSAGIKVAFVYTPEYVFGQKFVKNRKQLFGLIHKFSKQYRIPLYDYSADTICLNKAYFYNSEHLNKTGAELFSKKLAGDLKREFKSQ
jgi:hypothetical protein